MRLNSGFIKTLITGGLASVSDLGTLAILVSGLGLSPQVANIPSLGFAVVIQFVGNRYFAFNAAHGRLDRQLTGFIIVEIISFLLNAVLFHVLVSWFDLHYTLARLLGTFVVFMGFSYPLWRIIFKVEPLAATAKLPAKAEPVGNWSTR